MRPIKSLEDWRWVQGRLETLRGEAKSMTSPFDKARLARHKDLIRRYETILAESRKAIIKNSRHLRAVGRD